MCSRSVSNNGRTAGISVCITKGTTLKEIRVNLFYMNKCIFEKPKVRYFLNSLKKHVWSVLAYFTININHQLLPTTVHRRQWIFVRKHCRWRFALVWQLQKFTNL
jgi:hypothetical protein